jgi:uncharacterized protein YcbK (DUF882 family)
MSKLSPHFDRSEFACKCGCGADKVNPALIDLLERVRKQTGAVTILSGVRCKAHNKKVGGVQGSQHVLGNAADIKVGGFTPKDLYNLLNNCFSVDGMGLYPTFVHVDMRGSRARWVGK